MNRFLCAVENPSHCDFVKLRTILIRTHMHDLKDITSELHYENYRAQCIQTMTRCVCVSLCVCTRLTTVGCVLSTVRMNGLT